MTRIVGVTIALVISSVAYGQTFYGASGRVIGHARTDSGARRPSMMRAIGSLAVPGPTQMGRGRSMIRAAASSANRDSQDLAAYADERASVLCGWRRAAALA